ncbi:MAG: hypothetical protein AABX33_03305 [Nanoarchaeota archaeon]
MDELNQFRELLRENGFRLIDLRANTRTIANFQSYTNVITYIDRNTEEKTIIMPIFPNENGEYKIEGLNLENKIIFESLGFKVKTVNDKVFRGSGNIRCLINLANALDPSNVCPIA